LFVRITYDRAPPRSSSSSACAFAPELKLARPELVPVVTNDHRRGDHQAYGAREALHHAYGGVLSVILDVDRSQ
jgi:hypothetical protein